MKVYKILNELQNRILLTTLSWIFTLLISYHHKKYLLFLTFYLNNKIYLDKNFYFITTDVTDLLSSYLTLSYFLTNQLILIYFFYNVTIFLAPGLYNFEYKKIKLQLQIMAIVVCLCFLFTNLSLLPIFWDFFSNYSVINKNVPIYFEAKITEYVSLYIVLHYLSEFICIFYLLLYYTINFFKDNLTFLKNVKKFMVLFCFMIATLTTPPDVFSQVAVGLILIIINELLIFIIIIKN